MVLRSEVPSSLGVVLLAVSISGCGGAVRLQSGHRDRAITVDAKLDEWKDSLVSIKNLDLAVGLFNDETDLYVGIESRNRAINLQATNLGLTIWFDPGGGKEKKFGIEYPIGYEGSEGSLSRLAVRGPAEGDRREMALLDASGIEAKAATVDDVLIYEIKVPLQRSDQHPYAVGAAAGQSIGILLETPEPPPIKHDRGEEGMARGGGRGGRTGGRRRGGMGGGRGGGTSGGGTQGSAEERDKPRIPKSLSLTAVVQLAPAKEPVERTR